MLSLFVVAVVAVATVGPLTHQSAAALNVIPLLIKFICEGGEFRRADVISAVDGVLVRARDRMHIFSSAPAVLEQLVAQPKSR